MASKPPLPGHVTLWSVWQRTTAQFVSDTNLAGVNNAGRASHPLRRVFWCCLWVIGLGVTINDVTLVVNKFLAYPVSTDYTIVYDSKVTFPAITVCNQNSVMCANLLAELLVAAPDEHELFELANRSRCMQNAPKLCLHLYTKFVQVRSLSEMLQSTVCFQPSPQSCCDLLFTGKMASKDVNWHLKKLGCVEDHLRECVDNKGQAGQGHADFIEKSRKNCTFVFIGLGPFRYRWIMALSLNSWNIEYE